MVGVTKIGRRNANYWINAVAEGGEDYYTKPGEAPGEWMGELAAELGLAGQVERDAYAAVLAGKDPKSGDGAGQPPRAPQLGRRRGARRAASTRSSATTSASPRRSRSRCFYAVGSPEVREAVLRAHDHAVAEAVAYLERHACFVQRGKGGVAIEPGAGFLAMAFRHRSSRAGDPALHTHLVTANMTRAASDGRWLSLANPRRSSPLLREAKAAGHVYQAALRAERNPRARRRVEPRPQRLRRPRRDRAAGDRALLPAPGGDRRGDGRARYQLCRPPPKSPPTGPATPRTTASTPTPSARSGSRGRPSST